MDQDDQMKSNEEDVEQEPVDSGINSKESTPPKSAKDESGQGQNKETDGDVIGEQQDERMPSADKAVPLPPPQPERIRVKEEPGNRIVKEEPRTRAVKEEKFNISVKSLQGKAWQFDVSPDDEVRSLQRDIERKANIRLESQRLCHNGKELKAGYTLRQSGLTKGSTLNLVNRVQGG